MLLSVPALGYKHILSIFLCQVFYEKADVLTHFLILKMRMLLCLLAGQLGDNKRYEAAIA
jgi:hypothetical protein